MADDVLKTNEKHGSATAVAEPPKETVHRGSAAMPPWSTGELVAAPKFGLRNWFALLGPGLVLGGSAIGGGEWLLGPLVSATYGGTLLWLATLSILGQVVYNLEISRYTLYSGEPIFTGKFRTRPGPKVWVWVYLFLDCGSIFPYLAAYAATPLFVLIFLGTLPSVKGGWSNFGEPGFFTSDFFCMKVLGYGIFLLALVPLFFGGKVYNSLKAVMTFKIVVVFGFLLVLAFFYSSWSTWMEIGSGFFKFGNVPVLAGEDRNGNGVLDPGEDWDRDGKLDVQVEPKLPPIDSVIQSGEWPDLDGDGRPDAPIDTDGDGRFDVWPAIHGAKQQEIVDKKENGGRGDGQPDAWPDVIRDENGKTDGKPDTFADLNGDGYRDGPQTDNLIVAAAAGRKLAGPIDLSLIGMIAALAAIAGCGGLSNTPISNYTRDQGWGMGRHVGAIPSIVGGHKLALSHVGCVFKINKESLERWRGWYRHIVRDQCAVWGPACFIGIGLPCMLSIEFLRRGFVADQWATAAFTAGKVQERVADQSGTMIGSVFWFMVVFCGFIVLAPSVATSSDGVIRRWVDVFWTSSARLRKLDPKKIRHVYFGVLTCYAVFGGLLLLVVDPQGLIQTSTTVYNIALGFSCWHTLAVNIRLLPQELRPGWFVRIALALSGLFFFTLGVINILEKAGLMSKLLGV